MKKYQTVMSLLTIGAGIGIDAWNALPQEEGQALHNIMIDRIIWQMEELQVFIMQCFFYCGPILEKDPIQTQTNLYDEEPKREKTQGEMVDIAAQELANLPRFTAYAKVIEEREGEQTVLKKKIKTLPLPDLHESMENPAIEKAHTESKTRRDIEKEISKRQERWRRRERTVSQPPPSEEPPRRR